MKKIILLLIALFVLGILIAGCYDQGSENNEQGQENSQNVDMPILGADCATVPVGQENECCQTNFAGTETLKCIGNWVFIKEDGQCKFLCRDLGIEQATDSSEPIYIKNLNAFYCESDDDCACGMSLETAECEIAHVDTIKDAMLDSTYDGGICDDYCNSELGNKELKCIDSKCQAI